MRINEGVSNPIPEDKKELQKIMSRSFPSELDGKGCSRWREKHEQIERSVKVIEARVLGIMTPNFKSQLHHSKYMDTGKLLCFSVPLFTYL